MSVTRLHSCDTCQHSPDTSPYSPLLRRVANDLVRYTLHCAMTYTVNAPPCRPAYFRSQCHPTNFSLQVLHFYVFGDVHSSSCGWFHFVQHHQSRVYVPTATYTAVSPSGVVSSASMRSQGALTYAPLGTYIAGLPQHHPSYSLGTQIGGYSYQSVPCAPTASYLSAHRRNVGKGHVPAPMPMPGNVYASLSKAHSTFAQDVKPSVEKGVEAAGDATAPQNPTTTPQSPYAQGWGLGRVLCHWLHGLYGAVDRGLQTDHQRHDRGAPH